MQPQRSNDLPDTENNNIKQPQTMKKIFNFVAMTAVVLMMASCNDDVNLKKFKIETENISYSEVNGQISFVNQNEVDPYFAYGIEFKNTFLRNKADIRANLKTVAYDKGRYSTSGCDFYDLLPETEYVIYACKTDEDDNPIGDLEYITVKTNSSKESTTQRFSDNEGKSSFEQIEGTVEQHDGMLRIRTQVEDEYGGLDKLQLIFYSSSFNGSFGINDLLRSYYKDENSYIVYQNASDRAKGKFTERFGIINLSIQGSYNAEKAKYIYEGWIIVAKTFGDWERVTIQIECDDINSIK